MADYDRRIRPEHPLICVDKEPARRINNAWQLFRRNVAVPASVTIGPGLTEEPIHAEPPRNFSRIGPADIPRTVCQENIQGRAADAMQLRDRGCYRCDLSKVHNSQIGGSWIERRPVHGDGVSQQWLRQHWSPDRSPNPECLVHSTANTDDFCSCLEGKVARRTAV